MRGSGEGDGLNRRGFLTRGLARALGQATTMLLDELAPTHYVRPPGALPEAAFVAACTRCDACVPACPVQAIGLLGRDAGIARGTPVLDVNTTACAMCVDMPCAAVCPTAALSVPDDGWLNVRMATITLDETRCLPFHGVSCGVCARVCPVGETALTLDEAGRPIFGPDCTGCGICVTACVTNPSSLAASPP